MGFKDDREGETEESITHMSALFFLGIHKLMTSVDEWSIRSNQGEFSSVAGWRACLLQIFKKVYTLLDQKDVEEIGKLIDMTEKPSSLIMEKIAKKYKENNKRSQDEEMIEFPKEACSLAKKVIPCLNEIEIKLFIAMNKKGLLIPKQRVKGIKKLVDSLSVG